MAKEEQLYQASNKFKATNVVKGVTALHDHVIVTDMNFEGRKLASGILLLGDDGKTDGIRPRWARVYTVGPQQKDVKPGQWVLIEHGRWTRGFNVEIDGVEMILRRADPNALLFVSDEEPNGIDTISSAVDAQKLALPG
jgi:Chaperonin 10 Kd subunit